MFHEIVLLLRHCTYKRCVQKVNKYGLKYDCCWLQHNMIKRRVLTSSICWLHTDVVVEQFLLGYTLWFIFFTQNNKSRQNTISTAMVRNCKIWLQNASPLSLWCTTKDKGFVWLCPQSEVSVPRVSITSDNLNHSS